MNGKQKIRVLILPHFEVGDITKDSTGEAGLFYSAYFADGLSFDVRGGFTLYVNSGGDMAMCVTGSGKTASVLCLSCVLSDERFDFSQAYILCPGCAGGNFENTVPGDLCVVCAAADFDLGHFADVRDHPENERNDAVCRYHDASYDQNAFAVLNEALCRRVLALVSDIRPVTTRGAREMDRKIRAVYGGESREPAVITGAAVSGDCFWKGLRSHDCAKRIVNGYGSAYPFTVTEMEDAPIAVAAKRLGALDRLIILRVVVNADVFAPGETPRTLWKDGFSYNDGLENGETTETADIFPAAMETLFGAAKIIISAARGEGAEL